MSVLIFVHKGRPFGCGVTEHTQKIISTILEKLHDIGWKILVSNSLPGLNDKNTMFFSRSFGDFSSKHSFVCVSLTNTNKLLVTNLPQQLVQPFKQNICQLWEKGIKNDSYENGVLEMRMFGHPWSTSVKESNEVILMLQNLFLFLAYNQYVYFTNVKISKIMDAFYFRHDPDLSSGIPYQFCTICFKNPNRVQVFDVDETIAQIRLVMRTIWSHGKILREKNYEGMHEFIINGHSWDSCWKESIRTRYF